MYRTIDTCGVNCGSDSVREIHGEDGISNLEILIEESSHQMRRGTWGFQGFDMRAGQP
jgi:hypothetical protein